MQLFLLSFADEGEVDFDPSPPPPPENSLPFDGWISWIYLLQIRNDRLFFIYFHWIFLVYLYWNMYIYVYKYMCVCV